MNTTGNQNTTGNAATATKLQTARKIAGVAFDGSADITLTAANLNAYTKTEVANLLSSYASRSSLTGYSGNLDIVAETLVVKSGGSGGFAIWDIGTTTSGANMYIDSNPVSIQFGVQRLQGAIKRILKHYKIDMLMNFCH